MSFGINALLTCIVSIFSVHIFKRSIYLASSYLLARWRKYRETNICFLLKLVFDVRLCVEKMSDDVFKCSSETGNHWLEPLVLPALCSSRLSTRNNYVIHVNAQSRTHRRYIWHVWHFRWLQEAKYREEHPFAVSPVSSAAPTCGYIHSEVAAEGAFFPSSRLQC